MAERIGILGGGAMGEALLAGLTGAGTPPGDILLAEPRPRRATELVDAYGIRHLPGKEVAAGADALFVVVKPHDVPGTLLDLAPSLRPGTLVISLAAGVTTATLHECLPPTTPVIRVMPNTPVLVGQGMLVMSPGPGCTAEHLARAESLLSAAGRVLTVPEHQQDAVTAVSGSGPAYVFYVAEAMVEAGVHLGLPRPLASELVFQTLLGSSQMLSRPGAHPTLLREQVTSPAGTTAAALRELDTHAVRAAFLVAIEAARDRSAQH
ncbi:MAG: pyrroline-5-carboxylate reductase [Actinomycetota bacterium]|nr:pyrroline-5-carboxylate reductase [Actinomycetota bacterium]